MKKDIEWEMKKVKMSDLQRGPVRHLALSDEFIKRVKDYKQALAEVDLTTLEETLDSFQRDANPHTELLLWEHITKIYQWSVIAIGGLSLEQKKELLHVLIGLSMGHNDFSHIKTLTKEMIAEVKDRYQYE